MIGIPAEDWTRFRRWSDVILMLSYIAFDSDAIAAVNAAYFAVTGEMKAYLAELMAQGRAVLRDDLLTRLVEARSMANGFRRTSFLHGRKIPAGKMVMAVIGSANRGPVAICMCTPRPAPDPGTGDAIPNPGVTRV